MRQNCHILGCPWKLWGFFQPADKMYHIFICSICCKLLHAWTVQKLTQHDTERCCPDYATCLSWQAHLSYLAICWTFPTTFFFFLFVSLDSRLRVYGFLTAEVGTKIQNTSWFTLNVQQSSLFKQWLGEHVVLLTLFINFLFPSRHTCSKM